MDAEHLSMIERAELIAKHTAAGEFLYANNDTANYDAPANKYHFAYCEKVRPGYGWLSPRLVRQISDVIIAGTYEGPEKDA